LYTRNIQPFNSQMDHNEMNTFIIDFIKSAANKSIPMKSTKKIGRQVPWWSDTLSNMIKVKRTLSRRLDQLNKSFKKLMNSQVINERLIYKLTSITIEINTMKPQYNKISAKFRREVIQGRIISWSKYVSNITSSTPINQIWHKFRKINGSYTRPPRSPILHNGQHIHNKGEISNILGNHLASVSSIDNLDAHFRKYKKSVERIPINFEVNEELDYNYKFSLIELEHALASSNKSAPGKDNISFEMLINLAPLARNFLLNYYNHLWKKKIFPKEWKHAIIIPIAKPGKDPSIPNNYRPISLTSCLCKLMEKMVNNRLVWYLEKEQILSTTQSGSRKGRSTLDPLTNLENQIRRGFEQKHITVAIFFDIQKAYDTTWRHSILKSLHANGFRGELPMFIQNFLSERTFQTRIDNEHSNIFQLMEGVPQGSVLSCTLFALAINDIAKQLPNGINNSLYVDDFAIYYTTKNLRHAQRLLNLALANIEKWASSVGYKFSIEKTQAIIFYKDKRWLGNQNIDLRMNGIKINFKNNVKFLGVIFDNHLNWQSHIKYIKARASKALNLLRKLAHTTWGTKRQTMMMLYKAVVLSILDYGCPIYGSASENVLKNLDPIHHEGIRLCTGAFRSSPKESLYVDSGELPLKNRRNQISMQRALKIMEGSTPAKETFQEDDVFIGDHKAPFPIRTHRLFSSHEILDIDFIPQKEYPPPWTIHETEICTKLDYLIKKNAYSNEKFKQHALEHIRQYGRHNEIYTDGSKSNEGVGFAVISTNSKIQKRLRTEASVFTAELYAILAAVKEIEFDNNLRTIIYSDSRSAIEAIREYNPKHPIVTQIKFELHKKKLEGKITRVCWIPAHVGIKGNEEADKTAKEASTLPLSNLLIPLQDWKSVVKIKVMDKWQSFWTNLQTPNKLRNVKDSVKLWPSSMQDTRHHEVILTRLRIGHTRLTHGYLMSTPHDPLPYCNTCQVPLTIEHVLIQCTEYIQQRQRCFRHPSLKGILAEHANFSALSIYKFLQQSELINLI
ncbi:MAG TPA: hypothetical protein EYG81_05080, partial [Archaeoglobus profundus]|nr:hypothetical protein [Archaeoglobus profundus]